MAKEKVMLEAYCLKLKKKVEMLNAQIVKTSKGGFMAQGVSKEGSYKLSLMMSEANALEAIKNGVAKKAF